jgi:hypothetical protein
MFVSYLLTIYDAWNVPRHLMGRTEGGRMNDELYKIWDEVAAAYSG